MTSQSIEQSLQQVRIWNTLNLSICWYGYQYQVLFSHILFILPLPRQRTNSSAISSMLLKTWINQLNSNAWICSHCLLQDYFNHGRHFDYHRRKSTGVNDKLMAEFHSAASASWSWCVRAGSLSQLTGTREWKKVSINSNTWAFPTMNRYKVNCTSVYTFKYSIMSISSISFISGICIP